jgi:hypothetical protein
LAAHGARRALEPRDTGKDVGMEKGKR